jgi:prenylcysteine oxidase/farnesylcysteine lyase
VNAYNNSLTPVELGASIFVEVNTILKNATDLFQLRPKESESEEAEILGIWNGKEFVYTQKGDSWWNLAKLFWKYGLAPYRTQKLMKSTVGKFGKLYEYPFFPFRSLSDRALDLDLIPITSVTGEELLTANNVGGFPPKTLDHYLRSEDWSSIHYRYHSSQHPSQLRPESQCHPWPRDDGMHGN